MTAAGFDVTPGVDVPQFIELLVRRGSAAGEEEDEVAGAKMAGMNAALRGSVSDGKAGTVWPLRRQPTRFIVPTTTNWAGPPSTGRRDHGELDCSSRLPIEPAE